MSDTQLQRSESSALRQANAELQRRAIDAEQALEAFARGEVDAVAVATVATPILLQTAQAELRRKEKLLRAIFDGALDAILLADDQGRYVDANPAACALFGMGRDQLVGRSVADFADPTYDAEGAARELREKGLLRGRFRLCRPDGVKRTLDFSAVTNVAPGLHLSALRDITDQIEAEEAVRESHGLLEEAQAIAHVGSWALQLGLVQTVTWSRESLRIFGLSEGASPSAEESMAIIHPEDRERVVRAMQDVIEQDVTCDHEYRICRPDGSVRWVHGRAAAERGLDGRALRVLGSVQDVTDRHQALSALRASEERYRLIVESTSEGVWLSDAEHRTTYVNQRLADMLGYTREEMTGQSALMCLPEGGRETAMAMLERRRGGASAAYRSSYLKKDGSACWTLTKSSAFLDDSRQFAGTVELLTDISEHRQLEAARDQLAAIVESSEDAIVGVSLGSVVTSWNLGAEKLYQYRADEIVGRSIHELMPAEIEAEERGMLDRVAKGDAVDQFETKGRRKDGSTVDVAVTVTPIRDGDGTIVAVSKIARDLTAKRLAEAALRRTEVEFRQAQKMEAVGRLAGGIAHDFNNLLSIILGYSSLAMTGLKEGDPLRRNLGEIEAAGHRASALTRQLLAFSRKQILQPRVLEINAVIETMGSMLRRLLGEDIELTLQLAPDVGRVLADAGQLEQVVMNLAVNARDAMARGGKLTIATSNAEVAAGADLCADLVPGHYVLVAITDSGVGMDAATCARSFEPFFTTKEVGRGTGLGLSTVLGIVQQSGGRVSVHSEVGVGTTVSVHLPQTDRQVDAPLGAGPPVALRGTETILLVEDEPQVRAVASTILRRHGYDVLEASNGGEAYLLSREHAGTIHLLLTDVVMPRMSGRKLAEELAPQRPDMKVLFASGYTDDAIVQHGVFEAGVALINKPFTPDALLRKVREVLDSAASRSA